MLIAHKKFRTPPGTIPIYKPLHCGAITDRVAAILTRWGFDPSTCIEYNTDVRTYCGSRIACMFFLLHPLGYTDWEEHYAPTFFWRGTLPRRGHLCGPGLVRPPPLPFYPTPTLATIPHGSSLSSYRFGGFAGRAQIQAEYGAHPACPRQVSLEARRPRRHEPLRVLLCAKPVEGFQKVDITHRITTSRATEGLKARP